MSDPFFTPVSGFDLPRFAGVATFMRLPYVDFEHPRISEVQVGLIGALGMAVRRTARVRVMARVSCAICPR